MILEEEYGVSWSRRGEGPKTIVRLSFGCQAEESCEIDPLHKMSAIAAQHVRLNQRERHPSILSPFWLRTWDDNCCNQAWLLKNSILLKITEIWGIENVYPNGESHL
jgi:hypothetical protein